MKAIAAKIQAAFFTTGMCNYEFESHIDELVTTILEENLLVKQDWSEVVDRLFEALKTEDSVEQGWKGEALRILQKAEKPVAVVKTATLPMNEVFAAIAKERHAQDEKWGVNSQQSLAGMMLIMEAELKEAIKGWIKNREGKSAPLNEIVQVAAVAVRCLEKYGIDGTAKSTDDEAAWNRRAK